MTSKFLDQVREYMRTKGYAYKSEKTYVHWIKRFIFFHNKRHPAEMGKTEVTTFVNHLANVENVSAGTQNQALAALLLLYTFLGNPLGNVDMVRAKKSEYIPEVLTKEEVHAVFDNISGDYLLMAQIIYGGGLRLMECLRLRVKEIDTSRLTVTLHDTKSNRDRVTCLPASVVPALILHLEKVRAQWNEDISRGYGEVELPYALAKKYPNAPYEWPWQYVFSAAGFSTDPLSGHVRRHHVYETSLQKHFRLAVRKAGIYKRATIHTLRHSFATEMLLAGYDIRTVQELLGHRDVRTTMIYLHVLSTSGVRSPLDTYIQMPPSAIKRTALVES
jgi:integron integrase